MGDAHHALSPQLIDTARVAHVDEPAAQHLRDRPIALDVETLDMFADVSKEVDLRFVNVHPEAPKRLERAGLQPASE